MNPLYILHLSTECYPAAKAGGLGDVVGALPKYQTTAGHRAAVLMPRYNSDWIESQSVEVVFSSKLVVDGKKVAFSIERVLNSELGFELFLADLPGLFDRSGIYIDPKTGKGFADEPERNMGFQIATLEWLLSLETCPDILHCHDHHSALVPFLITEAFRYQELRSIPTILTIHNAGYQGIIGWERAGLIPAFQPERAGLLDWDGSINPLACGIKCAWKVTTVSPGYMRELGRSSSGLEMLFRFEHSKCVGILNGIDSDLWDPSTDTFLDERLDERGLEDFKERNKRAFCLSNGLDLKAPLFVFIGRFAFEKGADLLPEWISNGFWEGVRASFAVLGSGDHRVRDSLLALHDRHRGFLHIEIAYDESLARKLYAAADFLLMPSRIEPCGLNQLYAYRYGTIPIVHSVGGLRDTVRDYSSSGGTGISFETLENWEMLSALRKAEAIYKKNELLRGLRAENRTLDYSWEQSSAAYEAVYLELMGSKTPSHAR